MKLIVKKLAENARLPQKAHTTDAGLDLFAVESAVIRPGEVVKIKTGIAIKLPEGYFGRVCDRSSVGSKGLHVVAGVIDEPYRGEVLVCLANLRQGGDTDTYLIEPGDKIAQMLVLPYPQIEIEEGELDSTIRGEGGFGSTGA